jgi:hypothetical protein
VKIKKRNDLSAIISMAYEFCSDIFSVKIAFRRAVSSAISRTAKPYLRLSESSLTI